MKKSILNLGKALSKTEQKTVSGGNNSFCITHCWNWVGGQLTINNSGECLALCLSPIL